MMRKFLLIAAMLLVSGNAQAGQSRGLTFASNDDPASLTQPVYDAAKPSDQLKPLDTPKYVERPPLDVTPAPVQPRADKAMGKQNAKPDVKMAKRRRDSTEVRVIRELHRYGIYW
jgi:hypothetical protein